MNFLESKTYLDDLAAITRDAALPGKLAGSKILITGAGGLIASVLVDALAYCGKIEVYALSRTLETAKSRFGDRVQYITQDVTQPLDSDVCFDYIIHAAANAHPLAYATSPVDIMESNILGTMNCLEYAVKNNAGRVMFVSSSEVYGVDNSPSDPWRYGQIDLSDFRSAYPESKRAAEVLCAAYAKQYGIDTVIVRPWYVYGATFTEQSSRADAQFFRKAHNGENIVLKSAGAQMRSYCYVADCVTAMIQVLQKGDGFAYDICGKDDVTIRKFAEVIAKTADVNIVFEHPEEAEQSGYTKASNSVCGKIRASKAAELGYMLGYSIERGVERTLKILSEVW